MGYYTRYELSWQAQSKFKVEPRCSFKNTTKSKFCPKCGETLQKGKHTITKLDDIIGEYIENSDFYGAIDRSGKTQEPSKWYEAEDDLRRMSKDIPNVLFHLKAEGEDSGDIWDGWALNGKWQQKAAEIVRGTLDEGDWS